MGTSSFFTSICSTYGFIIRDDDNHGLVFLYAHEFSDETMPKLVLEYATSPTAMLTLHQRCLQAG